MKLTPETEKNFIALAAIAVAFGIFLFFFQNKDIISLNETDGLFTGLAALGMGLMLVLFFLVSQRASKGTKSASKKKRKR